MRPPAGRAPTFIRSASAPRCYAACGGTGTPPISASVIPTRPADPVSGQGGRSADLRPSAGRRGPADRSPDGAEAVRHVDKALTSWRAVDVEPGAVVTHAEEQPVRVLPQSNLDRCSWRVFGGVLEGFETAEVGGGLHL